MSREDHNLIDASATPERRDAGRTRARILDVAREHFAVHGLDGATVRGVAADAGVSPNLITRYFGGKRGLFDEATGVRLDVAATLGGGVEGMGARIAARVVGRWEAAPGADPTLTMLRAAMTDPEVAARTARMFHDEATAPLAAVLGRSGDLAAWDRAAAVSAVIKGVLVDRYVLGAPTVSAASPESLVAWLASILQQLLTGPAPASLDR